MSFAAEALRERVVRPCLAGEKIICLAVTEPTAGSDVAQLKCTAVLNAAKTHYVLNGVKKWITNGAYADFFTVLARTGDAGSGTRGRRWCALSGWLCGWFFTRWRGVALSLAQG